MTSSGGLLAQTVEKSATPGEKVSNASRRSRSGLLILALAILALLAALGFATFVLSQPMEVPDTSSPLKSNVKGNVDAEASVGQVFVPASNNLDQVSVVMITELRNDMSNITFTIRDGGPSGDILRTVKVPISELPEGEMFPYNPEHPGIRDQAWYTFKFEPIPDSAGRKLFFSLEGKYLPPQNRVRVALMFSGSYLKGKAYVNGDEQNAHVVFRAMSQGQVRDYLGVIAENLTAGKQGLLASPALYVALAAAYLALLGGLMVAVTRALKN